MTWICKKCGQIQPDSIIYSDGICDDCFEKINKKKKKGSAFNKILSLALVLSFMLCIFSGFEVASAEDTTDITFVSSFDGKYLDKYDTIAFDKNELISFDTLHTMYDSYVQADESINTLYVYLIGFDSSGAPHSYSTKSDLTFLSCSYSSTDVFSVTGPYINFNTSWFPYDYVGFGYSDTTAFHFYKETSDIAPEKYNYNFTYTDGNNEFNSLCSGKMYLVFVPFNSNAVDYRTILPSLLSGSPSDLNNQSSPVANFYTCKSAPFTDSAHGLYVKSWIKDGEQYPYFGWWINDNGNNHKYKVVFSYNDTQKELFETFYNSTKSNPLFSQGWWVEKAFPILSVSKESMIIANEIATQTGFADFMADKTWWLWHYNTLFTLNHSSMDFTSETGNKIYSVNLSDYSAIYEYLFYRAQIVDITTGNILDTVYFTSQESFNKSDSGYGSKVYDYGDDSQGMIEDLKNNSPSGEPDNFGKFQVDGDIIEGGILDDNGNLNYEFNINQIVGTLNNATVGMGQFFSACLNIIPSAFISILLGSFALIVLLRVLGR